MSDYHAHVMVTKDVLQERIDKGEPIDAASDRRYKMITQVTFKAGGKKHKFGVRNVAGITYVNLELPIKVARELLTMLRPKNSVTVTHKKKIGDETIHFSLEIVEPGNANLVESNYTQRIMQSSREILFVSLL